MNKKLQHKYLVYTSAGDNANLEYWLKGRRNFDLWITYYGDYEGKFQTTADYYNARKGGKFPNLHYVYQHWPEVLSAYEALLVIDDDILIDASKISRLFEIRDQYDLWLLQPAFDPRGKVSHRMTSVRVGSFLRYSNFVEVCVPLFRKDKLDEFMNVYEPALVGWGIDWWYMEVLGSNLEGKVAIVDEVICVNPHDGSKKVKTREIERLQSTRERIAVWQTIKKRYHIQSEAKGQREYGGIPLPFLHILKTGFYIMMMYSLAAPRKIVSKIYRKFLTMKTSYLGR